MESAVEGITMYLGLSTIEYQHRSLSAMNMLHIPEMTTYTFTMTCFYFHLLLSIETGESLNHTWYHFNKDSLCTRKWYEANSLESLSTTNLSTFT